MRVRHFSALVATAMLGAGVLTAGPAQAVPAPGKVTFTVQGLSPNGDGHHDAAYLHFDLSAPATGVSWHIAKAGSRLAVTKVRSLGDLAVGDHEITWNGKDSDGTRARNGNYALYLKADLGDGSRTFESGLFRVDSSRPVVKVVDPGATSVYPQVDGYRDTVTLRASSPEPFFPMKAAVTDAAGHVVRAWALSASATPHVVWNGLTASGRKLEAGRYSIRWSQTDELGNTGRSGFQAVYVSAKALVSRYKTETVTPHASAQSINGSSCATVKSPAAGRGWSGSVALRGTYCAKDNHKTADAVAVLFAGVKSPGAVGSWSASLEVYGVGTNAAGMVRVVPVTSPGQPVRLNRSLGWHDALHQVYPAAQQATEDVWGLSAEEGAGYDVRWFRVTFHYHVLVG
jgi:flagellar hook assembly protein FlgD